MTVHKSSVPSDDIAIVGGVLAVLAFVAFLMLWG